MASASSHAGDGVDWSLTIEAGVTQGADRTRNFQSVLANRAYMADLQEYDNSSFGYGVSLEARLHKYFGFELAYRDLGKTQAKFSGYTINAQYGRDVVNNQGLLGRGLSLGGKFHVPVSDSVDIWTQLGVFLWQDSANFHNKYRAGLADPNYRRSNLGIDPFWGVGMVYQLDELLNATVAYRQFKVDRQTVRNFSLGLGFKFGDTQY